MRRRMMLCLLLMVIFSSVPCFASAGISDLQFTYQATGDVLLQWKDTDSGPYKVYIRLDNWAEGKWAIDADTYATYDMMHYLVPGQTYNITVMSSTSSQTTRYTVPFDVYREYATGGKYLSMSETSFSLRELENDPLLTFRLSVSWPKLRRDRDYFGKVALKTPLGYSGRLYYWDSFQFGQAYTSRVITFSMLQDWMNSVKWDFDSIPTGQYRFEFYTDGALYDYVDFYINP